MACPVEKQAISIPLERLSAFSKSQSGYCTLVATIISGMLGMEREAIKKPDIDKPKHIETMFISSKNGLIKPVANPTNTADIISVTRASTLLGINGVSKVPIAYESG